MPGVGLTKVHAVCEQDDQASVTFGRRTHTCCSPDKCLRAFSADEHNCVWLVLVSIRCFEPCHPCVRVEIPHLAGNAAELARGGLTSHVEVGVGTGGGRVVHQWTKRDNTAASHCGTRCQHLPTGATVLAVALAGSKDHIKQGGAEVATQEVEETCSRQGLIVVAGRNGQCLGHSIVTISTNGGYSQQMSPMQSSTLQP